MLDLYRCYIDISIAFGPDLAKYIIENFIKRDNIKAIKKCCRYYNHYEMLIRESNLSLIPTTIRIQLFINNVTLVFHNLMFPDEEGKSFRVDAIIRKNNINIYVMNFPTSKDLTTLDTVLNISDVNKSLSLLKDIKKGLFNDYMLIKTLSTRIQ